jgi:DNA primase catalytic core
MARIPDDIVDRLKRQISLERLVSLRGVELKRHGADLVGLCPLHDDKTPSLVISPKKNLWHCLGACQRGGSVIDWVMAIEGVSFRRAVDVLLQDAPGMALSEEIAPPAVSIDTAAEDRELLAQVVAYYHEALRQSPEALDYLKGRGLGSPDVAAHFKLGFANRTLGYRLPSHQTRAGVEARERLQKVGVLRESGHEHFNGSIVIPIVGAGGEVLGMYGRKITLGLRKGTPLHLYMPGPHRGVFNIDALRSSKTIILCEALIDALTFWCAGFKNVTASYGVEGFTADHKAAFKAYGTERVLIAYDRDDAGERAAEKLAAALGAEGIECWRVQFPKGMDANEYACKVTPSDKSLAVLIRNAVWMGKGQRPAIDLVDALLPRAPAASPIETVAEASAVLDEDFVAPLPAALAPLPAPVAVPMNGAAAPLPSAAKEETQEAAPAELDDVVLTFADRRYRVRGLEKNLSHDQLRVNLLASRGEDMHVDTLELYSSRQRSAFIKQSAAEMKVSEEIVAREVGRVLLRLEEIQAERIKKALEPKVKEVKLTDDEAQRALELLEDPKLLDRILADFAAGGVVGEETNKLVGYLAAVSRKLDEPLAVVIQSSSAAGKTALMEAVLAMMPEEDRVKYSAMTGQSLFYMGETNLKHKILAIVEEQGAERAAYALKLLQSEGELTIASTGKDPQTGRLVTHEYRVEGPVMIFLTTTAIEIDEELLNRCLVLTVDEDREQTRAIHRRQREGQTLEGMLARHARPGVLKVHQNAQRLLKPILVTNPFARQLTFLDDRTRTRRDHVKYLTLIRTIALLHQYQRPIKTAEHGGAVVPYIEVTLEDVAVANRLAHQVLGRSLDELAPQTRRLLMALDAMVRETCEAQKIERSEYRFTRRQVRERIGWGNTQVHTHLSRLVEMEYLLVHRGSNGQGYVYELVYEGQGKDGTLFLPGLIDVEALRSKTYDGHLSGSEADLSGGIRPRFGPVSAGFRGEANTVSSAPVVTDSTSAAREPENAHQGREEEAPPNRSAVRRGPVAVGR